MKVRKSFVLTSALPSSASDITLFEKALVLLKDAGYETVEFYADFDIAAQYKEVLEKYGLEGIFLAAGYQKKNNLCLCDVNEVERRKAIVETMRCIDAAQSCKVDTVLITSGVYPGAAAEQLSWENLSKSIKELADYSPTTILTMEPGDRAVDARQLAGPTEQTVNWAKQLQSVCPNFRLTMDTSHIAQLGERACDSISLSKGICSHIHLANCILKPNHPLYGDKHPFFSHADAVYSLESLKLIASDIIEHYPRPVTLAIEIINRSSNEWQEFLNILEEERWFSDLV